MSVVLGDKSVIVGPGMMMTPPERKPYTMLTATRDENVCANGRTQRTMMQATLSGRRTFTPPYLILIRQISKEIRVFAYLSAIKLGTKRPKTLAAFMMLSK